MAKIKAKPKRRVIKIVIEKRSEPLKVPDLKLPDSLNLGKFIC